MKLFYPSEYKALLKLGVPIVIGQMGLTLQNLMDNVMVGQHSTEELAAAGFVNNLFVMAILLALGFSMGAISQIGALYSQQRKADVITVFKSSLWADGLQALILVALLMVVYFCLPYMGQPDDLVPMMKPYMLIQIASLPFMANTNAFKQFTDSINDTKIAAGVMLVGNVWNVFFNWVLIFGKWGFPELGIIGAAWATFSSRVLMFLLYAGMVFWSGRYSSYMQHWRTSHSSRAWVLKLFRLGWPIGIQMGMEVAAFTLVSVFMGWISMVALATHQVMLSLSNLIFMFYVGISTAVSIRVSNYNGLRNMTGVRHAAFAGYEIILCIGVVLSAVVFTFRNEVSYLFTDNEEVAMTMATLVFPLVIYQFGDGTQAVFSNALRGLGDVKKLMKYSFIAYILISLPLSYFFGIVLKGEAFGIWMAFPFGLTVAGLLYLRRFLRITDKYRITPNE